MVKKGGKGTYSSLRLSVLKGYLYPHSRAGMTWLGLAGVGALLLYFAADFTIGSRNFTSRGELSSNHAGFGDDCEKCHDVFRAVSDAKCSTCHEKTGDVLGVYTFGAHYVYHSFDTNRIAGAVTKSAGHELDCAGCHPDHRGRDAQITAVSNTNCMQCHEQGSFNDGHPEFAFLRENRPDDSALHFTHRRHTRFVIDEMDARGEANLFPERACLTCHTPDADGRGFEPISFDNQCASCHLTGTQSTGYLQLASSDLNLPGVETLESMRKRFGPGASWTVALSTRDFIKVQNRVKRTNVRHRDPWIEANLRRIRSILYSETGAADLLTTSGRASNDRPERVYQDMLDALREYAAPFKGRPGDKVVQRELESIDSVLGELERRLEREKYVLDDAAIIAAVAAEAPLSADVRSGYLQLVSDLTSEDNKLCAQCHVIVDARIARVQMDQDILRRSRFNHRAHILDRSCLDCHTEIPITRRMMAGVDTNQVRDASAIQNIPGIDNCQSCHNSTGASENCLTCHDFHPQKFDRKVLTLSAHGR